MAGAKRDGALTAYERSQALNRAADLLAARIEEFAASIARRWASR